MNKEIAQYGMDVSVIIPAYNAENYISECIDSLIGNIRPHIKFEAIIINDASTDNTRIVIDEYCKKYDFIKLIDNDKNIGQGASRNKGIASAAGRYLMFCDSDDCLIPGSIQTLYEEASKYNYDLVIYNFIRVNNGIYVENNRNDLFKKYDTKDIVSGPQKYELIFGILAPWNKFVARELLEKNQIWFDEKRAYEDLGPSIAFIHYAQRISVLSEPLYQYRVRPDSSIHAKSSIHTEIFSSYENILRRLHHDNVEKKVLDCIYGRYIHQLVWYLDKYRRKMPLRTYFEYYCRTKKVIKAHYDKDIEKILQKYVKTGAANLLLKRISLINNYGFLVFLIERDDMFRKNFAKIKEFFKKKIDKGSIYLLRKSNYKIEFFRDGFVSFPRALSDYARRERVYNYLYYRYLKKIIRDKKINLVIDVGANKGQFSAALRKYCNYKGNIISFEPIPYIFQQLKKKSRGDKKWKIHNIALGNLSENRQFNVSEYTVFSSFLSPNNYSLERFGEKSAVKKSIEVQVSRFDEIFTAGELKEKNILLKLDTQGFDICALQGFGNLIDYVDILHVENSVVPIYENMTNIYESLKFYEDNGFSLANMFPVTFDDGINKVIEFDCILFRKL